MKQLVGHQSIPQHPLVLLSATIQEQSKGEKPHSSRSQIYLLILRKLIIIDELAKSC